ncbi:MULTISPECIES: hypothetical protein [unclassified Haladaptatus]|uniref:hypothetical protein n=1 Tax=unclassified Haladaptatus TaxID=2622732 RepID=UPI0023E8255A|nr:MULTISPECIES: hypothetical protein [unclassified Haladaptatus]
MLTEGEVRARTALHGEQTVSELATSLDLSQLQAVLLQLGYDIVREPDEAYEELGAQRIRERSSRE